MKLLLFQRGKEEREKTVKIRGRINKAILAQVNHDHLWFTPEELSHAKECIDDRIIDCLDAKESKNA